MRPVYPQPGFVEADTVAALATGQFVYMDCYTIIPIRGDPLRYTTAQFDESVVSVGGITRDIYIGGRQVIITGLRVKNNLGVEVDEQEVNMSYPAEPVYQASLTWAQALLQGRLDGASIRRDRYIATAWGQPWLGGMPMFQGVVSTLNKVGRMSATVNVKSDLINLTKQAPPWLWIASCKNRWGDPACGVDQSVWAVPAIAGASPTRSVIPWASASTDYNRGKIHISNGDSVTRVRTISRATATELYLAYPLDFDPVAGMEFTAYPGCTRDDNVTTGCPKYHGVDWRSKFKGFPFIPVAETALG